MCYYSKITLPVVITVAVINIYFLYKYSGLEYNVETDTDVIIRKLIALEEKIQEICKQ
jgi:hypothetical protein